MNAPRPKRHHYVPCAILKRFTDTQGWLHLYSKLDREPKVRPTRVENAFCEGHLYSEEDDSGLRDPTLEEEFGRLEGVIDSLLNKFVSAAEAGALPQLTPEERSLWDLFLVLQWKRVPDLHRTVATDQEVRESLRRTREEYKVRFPDRTEEIDALAEPDTERRIIKNARVGSLKSVSPRVLNALQTRGVALLRIKVPSKAFIIGSRPVVQMAFRDGLSLVDEATEMWLPITSTLAVGAGRRSEPEVIYDLHDSSLVRRLNLAIAAQSSAFASASVKLTTSVANAR